MLDINGQPLRAGDTAQLLCEILEITGDVVVVRLMNSELQLAIGAKHDEVLGGLVADSELTLFERLVSAPGAGSPEPEAAQLQSWPME